MAAWGQPPVSTPTMRSAAERGVPLQELGVLGGVDVVRDHPQADAVTQGFTEAPDECGLAGADRPGNADPPHLTGHVSAAHEAKTRPASRG